MKKTVTLAVTLLLATQLISQDLFKVINVNGEIIATNANIALESGIEVSSDDNFDFVVPNSRAAMINSELGRVILTEQNADDAFSRAAFAPAMSSISTRGTISSAEELNRMFSGEVLIIDKLELSVSSSTYQMDEKHFFYISYQYNNETINKQLPFKDDTFFIEKADLFLVDDKPIKSSEVDNLKLYYYKRHNIPESVLIAEFNALFLETEQIKPEIQIIVQELEGSTYEKITNEVYGYLRDFYGIVDRENLGNWLFREFNIKNY